MLNANGSHLQKQGLAVLKRFFLALAASLALSLPAMAQDTPLKIVATTGMIADAVANVGGGRVEVTALMGTGIDPHSYRQTRSDMENLLRADIVFWNGLYLEAQMERFLLELAEQKPVIAVAEAIPQNFLLDDEEYEGRYDPHVWLVPSLWVHAVERVRDTLIEADPRGANIYFVNAERYISELKALQTYADAMLGTIPEERRILVTAHDAFGYFGRAFNMEVEGIQGISTESEAGLARISELVELIIERRVPAIFAETSVSDRNLRALIEGAAARGHDTRLGPEIYSDAMGEQGTYQGTYIGMIDHNVSVITQMLGGSVPKNGLNGRLNL